MAKNDGPMKVYLKSPIQYGDDVIDCLELQIPRAKHLKGIKLQSPTMDDMILLAGRLAGQAPSVMDELEMGDLQTVIKGVNSFLDVGAVDGKTD